MANFKNGAIGIVATAPSPATSGTSLAYQTGHGSRQPAVPYFATAYPTGVLPNPSNWEIILVTARSTDTITIVRAQKGSTAQSIATGWIIANGVYDDDLYNAGITAPELLSGTPNGVLTTFGLSQPYTMLLGLYKNGVYMRPGAGNDYTLSGSIVTFATAPATSSVLVAIGIVGSQANIAGGNSMMPPEVPTGTINGTNKAFTVSRSYVAGSPFVFINGLLQQPKVHYVETSPTTGIITLDDAPLTGDNVLISYQWSAGVTGNADTVDGFNASSTPAANQLMPLGSDSKFNVKVLPGTILATATRNTTLPYTGGDQQILSIVVTVTQDMIDSGRKLKLTFFAPQMYSNDSSSRARVTIYEGATVLTRTYQPMQGGNVLAMTVNIATPGMAMPSLGNHTYTVNFSRDVGTGTSTLYAETGADMWLEAEIK